MPEVKTRVALADDHAIVLRGLETFIAQQPDFTVVATCHDGREALAVARAGRAEILILDLRMPEMDGMDVLRALHAEGSSCRVVLLTATIGDGHAVEALRLGAMGLVLKESHPDTLLECLRCVSRGQQWVDRQTMTRAFGKVLKQEAAVREAAKTLTPREIEIVRLIAEGHRNRGIGDRLCISEGTVKIHLHNVYQKVGVNGRLELVLWAQEQGLV